MILSDWSENNAKGGKRGREEHGRTTTQERDSTSSGEMTIQRKR